MRAALCLLALLMAGCASLKPRDFANERPLLEPDRYFTGHTRSWGVFETRGGEPAKRYTTDCIGQRDASGDLILDQRFLFNDGAKQHRVWHIHRLDAHRYEATANDTIGKAGGEAWGNTFRWEYDIALKPGHPLSAVHIRQWMYLTDDRGTLMTRLVITKFGIRVAEVAETFRHVSE